MKKFLLPAQRPQLALATLTALLAAGASNSALACATCGCSLSTDAAMGDSILPGWRVSVEYDFINQDQLRNGRNSVDSSQAAAVNDAGGNQEVEKQTINRYLTFGVAYAPNSMWNLSLLAPMINRGHTTYGAAGTDQLNSANVSGANVRSLGDIKFITSYQGLLPEQNLGLQLGVKLPTGNYGGPNAEGTGIVGHRPVAFNNGPNSQNPSPGNLLDTSLNAGNGSTDLIVGAYYRHPITTDFAGFINGQFQASVSHRLNQPGQDFRPGNIITTSFGARYEANPMIVPQLQVNLSHKAADQGALADTGDTAGTVAYLSPGLTATIAPNLQLFAFVQLPVYSRLSGYQLFPHWTGTIGLSYGL